MSHAPGPWNVYLDQGTGKVAGAFPGISDANGNTIVLFGEADEGDLGIHGDDPIANAHLIAAAPDLLAASKKLWALIDDIGTNPLGSENDRVFARWEFAELREAIAKAEGG
jgi:hypothetical protein